jgi:proton-translocating NAD(P)+ transhydrogenase subunit alpha
MILGVPKETFPGERRVALTPKALAGMKKLGLEIMIERGAGEPAGFSDAQYEQAGAKLASRPELFEKSRIVAQVRTAGANPQAAPDLTMASPDQLYIGLADPLSRGDGIAQLAEKNAVLFALELLPRITRAQTMDVLSSQATVAGYKAVLLAANALPKMFPMLTTAAGTLAPAKVLILGAGVAGLQAIATARRLGGVVSAYDVRAAVKEQIESLGARFVTLELQAAEGAGGYAKAMDEAYYKRQRELLAQIIKDQDVVITTAAVPGAKSPLLVTADAVRSMVPGSVIVDLAAERGGNCELTRAGETVVERGVSILGPLNLPSTIPTHASEMYAKNVTAFLALLVKKGELKIDTTDEIVRETLITQSGNIVHPRVRQAQGLPPLDVQQTVPA